MSERWSDNPVGKAKKELSENAYVEVNFETGRTRIVKQCPMISENRGEIHLDKEEVENLIKYLK